MKKFLLSLVFIAIGSGAWWVLSRSASHSVKNWDAKFESIFRSNLLRLGLSDQDVISSVHEVKKDARGEWVFHQSSLSVKDPMKLDELRKEFKRAGAEVIERTAPDKSPIFVIKKGPRVYQEIKFLPQ